MKQKPCTYCGELGHTSIACFKKPRHTPKNKKIKYRLGPEAVKWIETRNQWIQNHPCDHDGYWYCHYCGVALTMMPDLLAMGVQYLTVDHFIARSTDQSLRHTDSNLVPACGPCNSEKGSTDGEAYLTKHKLRFTIE